MDIIKWEPFNVLEQLFDDRSLLGIRKFGSDLAIDLYEENGNIVAKMMLPYVNPDDINVSIEKDTLIINGAREEEKETKEKEYFSKEIRRGSFSRYISLPKSVDAAKVTAQYKDGVLHVAMPILEGTTQKTIKVEVKK